MLTRWTPDKDARLLSLFAEGLSVTKIGHIMGTTRGSIAGRLNRLGAFGLSREYVRDRSTDYKRRNYNSIERGDWNAKTFEPWSVYRARKVMERERDRAQA